MSDHPSKSRWAVGLVALSVFAWACGSTVPLAEQEAAEEAAEVLGTDALEGLPPGATVNEKGQIVNAEGEVIGTVPGGAPVASGGVASGPGTGGAVASGETSGTASGSTGTASGSNGIGVTSNTISIGVVVVRGGDEAAASLGAPGVTQVSKRKVWEALAEETNKAGGILGKKVVPVFHEVDAASSQTTEQQGQEACADWTQDRPVFATPGFPSFGESFLACMGKAGAVISGGSVFTVSDERIFERHPYFLQPNTMDLNTQGKLLPEALYGQKYFGKSAKIGLVTFDTPEFRYATEQSLLPSLQRRGLKLATEPAYLTFPRTLDQYSATSADARNAVLRFSSQGITHVMFMDFGAVATVLFAQAAENQQYRPRYGLNSQAGPTIAPRSVPNNEMWRNQLDKARAVGWAPAADVSPNEEPANKTRERCLAIMQKHNVAFSSSNARGQAIQECDALWFLIASLEASGSQVINQATFLQGVARLGSGYGPGMTFATTVSSSRHDGSAGARNLSFDRECVCFHYTSPVYAVSD